MNELVILESGNAITTSMLVGEKFGKEHFHILRDIEQLIEDIGKGSKDLFEISSYRSGNGKENKMYFMNKDGFALLAMGFTGKEAIKWKLEYIKAFNKMEQKLKEGYQRAPLAITGEVKEIREYGEKIIKAVDFIEEAADEVSKEMEEKLELFGKLFSEEKMKEYCEDFIRKIVANIGTMEEIESIFHNVQELKGKVKRIERMVNIDKI